VEPSKNNSGNEPYRQKKQNKNIFIYLLCYNFKGRMIEQERIIYLKMSHKVYKANKLLKKNVALHPINIPNSKIIYKKMPKMLIFNDLNTFESKLKKYINYFYHSYIKDRVIYERDVYTYEITKKAIINNSIEYLYVDNILNNYPWLIETSRIITPLLYRQEVILSGEYSSLLKKSIKEYFSKIYSKNIFDKNYKVIFILNCNFTVNYFNRGQGVFPVVYVLGQPKTGRYDLLGLYNPENNGLNTIIFNDLKNKYRISRINLIIGNTSNLHIINQARGNNFKTAKAQFCFSSIFNFITQNSGINEEEINYVNLILSAKNVSIAKSICEEAINNKFLDSSIFERLFLILKMREINTLYKIEPIYRNRICTNNIIVYIAYIVQILLKENVFYNNIDLLNFIDNSSNLILKYGKHFIPNWDELTKNIE
jgi:hypothetical protein